MKRILPLLTVLVLTLAFAVPASAQKASHFKFMGIPINGTITNFQSRLASKGFTYDAKASKQSGPGIRIFNGMFSGYKAQLGAYFDSKTKIVYNIKVIIGRYNRDAAKDLYKEMRSNLLTKYAGKSTYEDAQVDGEDATYIYVFQDENMIGVISVYIQDTIYSDYWVAIEYMDVVNSDKHTDSQIEDL